MTAPTDALRHQIAHACHPVKIVGRGTVSRSKLEMADAVLALPAIADAVALAERVEAVRQYVAERRLAFLPITVERIMEMLDWFPTDDERALLAWEDKR